MRRLLPLLFVGVALFASAVASATEFSWLGQDKVSLTLPKDWRLESASEPANGATYRLTTADPADGLLIITVARIPPGRTLDSDQIKDQLLLLVAQRGLVSIDLTGCVLAPPPVIPNSTENNFAPLPLKSAQGIGWYAQFTDPVLVGKAAAPGNFKKVRIGLVRLNDHALATVTMLFNDPAHARVTEMMSIAESLLLKEPAPRPSPASP